MEMDSDLAETTPRRSRVLRKRDRRKRTSFSESPTQSSSSPRKKRRKVEEATDELWAVREILEERRNQGRLEYLVDWEDSKVTGVSFSPTWVCIYTSDQG